MANFPSEIPFGAPMTARDVELPADLQEPTGLSGFEAACAGGLARRFTVIGLDCPFRLYTEVHSEQQLITVSLIMRPLTFVQ